MDDMVIRFRTYECGYYVVDVAEVCRLAGHKIKTTRNGVVFYEQLKMAQAKKLLKFMILHMNSEDAERVQQYVKEHNPKLYAAVYD